jgi:hypothetical protein
MANNDRRAAATPAAVFDKGVGGGASCPTAAEAPTAATLAVAPIAVATDPNRELLAGLNH